jgi:hypothetical protein
MCLLDVEPTSSEVCFVCRCWKCHRLYIIVWLMPSCSASSNAWSVTPAHLKSSSDMAMYHTNFPTCFTIFLFSSFQTFEYCWTSSSSFFESYLLTRSSQSKVCLHSSTAFLYVRLSLLPLSFSDSYVVPRYILFSFQVCTKIEGSN